MMIDANAVTENEVRERPPKTEASFVSPLWNWLSLGGIMLISLFMNFYQLGKGSFGNPYYAAGVRSMLDSWHNFFFVSYDPGGFVTIDKPPLGFWLQTLSVKVFGFTPFSVYLPQALAGVISVLLLYHLVQRHFGKVAGLLAALALALSPISVVTNRNNTIDSTLTLVLLLGAWAVIRAAETGRLRWLLVCVVCVGLGFNIKMLQAYLVVPAFGLLYLVAAPRKIWTRIWHLFVAIVVLLVISLSWMIVVDLTPASQRPYVGSSQDNSEISLAIGYNGIDRLLSDLLFRGNRGEQQYGAANVTSPMNNGATNQPNGTQQERANVFGGGGGAFSQGMAGPFRLFDQELGGQIAWLLPLSLLAIVALAWQRKWRLQEDRRLQSMVVWGIWLLTMGIFFSVAGFFYQYYLTTMAPAVAALFGIGIVTMWGDYRAGGWRGWLLPVVIAITVVTQLYILSSYPTWSQWLSPLIGILGAVVVLALLVPCLIPMTRNNVRMLRQVVAALSFGVAVLLIAPTVWAGYSVINNTESQIPTAGPNPQNTALRFGGDQGFPGGRDFPGGQGMPPGGPPIVPGGQGGQFRMGGENTTVNAALISYLESNRGNAKYLLAVPSSMSANSIITPSVKPLPFRHGDISESFWAGWVGW